MFDWLWLLVDWRPAENLQSVNLHGTCHYPDTKTTEVRMQVSVSWPHVERASAAKRDDGQFWDPLQYEKQYGKHTLISDKIRSNLWTYLTDKSRK